MLAIVKLVFKMSSTEMYSSNRSLNMSDHLASEGYELFREQLINDNPYLLARREGWADRSAGPDACHPYLSTKDEDGYGKRRIRYQGRHITVPVSRIEIALSEGYIAADREAAHLCQNQTCVNPRHLEAMLPGDHRRYDAEPKRQKRRAKYVNGTLNFPVWTGTNEDVGRIDRDAEAREARLLAGHLVRGC
jgi:hypothetical protein